MSAPQVSITERIRERLAAGAGSRGVTMPTLDDLKDMLGIATGDTSLDDEITDGFATTLAVVEAYLGRGVAFADQVQAFEPVESRNRRLMLFRFPVSEVRTVSVDGAPVTGWRVFHQSGILEWRDGCCAYLSRAPCGQEPVISVEYSGGYADDAWPADLMDAILRAFFARWHSTGDTGNTADISSQGPIRNVNTDGSGVTWADHQATAEHSGAGPIPAELIAVSAQLDPYRQRLVTGV